jgi:hypothetical protein
MAYPGLRSAAHHCLVGCIGLYMQASQVQKWQPSLHSQKRSGAAFPTMQACMSALPDSPHLFSSTTTRSQQVARTGACPTWPTTATPPMVAAPRRISPTKPAVAARKDVSGCRTAREPARPACEIQPNGHLQQPEFRKWAFAGKPAKLGGLLQTCLPNRQTRDGHNDGIDAPQQLRLRAPTARLRGQEVEEDRLRPGRVLEERVHGRHGPFPVPVLRCLREPRQRRRRGTNTAVPPMDARSPRCCSPSFS